MFRLDAWASKKRCVFEKRELHIVHRQDHSISGALVHLDVLREFVDRGTLLPADMVCRLENLD